MLRPHRLQPRVQEIKKSLDQIKCLNRIWDHPYYSIVYQLENTKDVYLQVATAHGGLAWIQDKDIHNDMAGSEFREKLLTFETVLALSPPTTREELLFHLDLFV